MRKSLSGCIHRFSSKAIIALSTQAEIDDLFQQTLIGTFNSVNARIGFYFKVLLQNGDSKPNKNLKIIYKIGNEDK